MKSKLINCVFILLFYSCNEQENRNLYNVNVDSIPKQRIIPYSEDSSAKSSRQQPFLLNLANLIGLQSIKKGSEGLYSRIWIWEREKKYVINIHVDSLQNKCFIVEFNSKKNDSGEFIVVHNEWKDLNPKSGWKNFIDTLNKYQLADLKSGPPDEMKRRYMLTHGAYIQFEIAQPNKYRYYEFYEPSYFRTIDKSSDNVFRFLEFFNQEMNILVYNPDRQFYAEKY